MTGCLILVHAYLDAGCSQEEGEVGILWKPINFMIYSDRFHGMAEDAALEWIGTFKLEPETPYEAIFRHVVERDGAGAVLSEYFTRVSTECKP